MPAAVHEEQRHGVVPAAGSLVDYLEHEPTIAVVNRTVKRFRPLRRAERAAGRAFGVACEAGRALAAEGSRSRLSLGLMSGDPRRPATRRSRSPLGWRSV
nr:hypothetical protein MFLOJ_16570 [Mycobacterium florentinum]